MQPAERLLVASDDDQLLVAALRDPVAMLSLPVARLDRSLRLVHRARLSGRVAFDLHQRKMLGQLDPVVDDFLTSALVGAESRARAAGWELDRVAWALADLPDIPLVAMKGCAYLLAGTPNARGRLFADVDLLVPERHVNDIEERLVRTGWRAAELTPYDDRYYRRWAHELPPLVHFERGVEVDVHHNILMRTARLRPSAELLLDAAREVPGSRFKVLAPVDMVLQAMVHLFYGGEMRDALRELVDIDDLLRHYAATEPAFWDQFWPRAKALDLQRPAFYGLRYARAVLGAPVPAGVSVASQVGAPSESILWSMDRLVPRALFPNLTDAPSLGTTLARQALYARSHWVKMPPVMLARHLSSKVYARFRPRKPEETAQA